MLRIKAAAGVVLITSLYGTLVLVFLILLGYVIDCTRPLIYGCSIIASFYLLLLLLLVRQDGRE
jgi:hypothetical protein